MDNNKNKAGKFFRTVIANVAVSGYFFLENVKDFLHDKLHIGKGGDITQSIKAEELRKKQLGMDDDYIDYYDGIKKNV